MWTQSVFLCTFTEPMSSIKPLHPDLVGIVDQQCIKAILSGWAGFALLTAMAAFFVYWGIKIPFVPILLIGLAAAAVPFWVYWRFKGDFKGASFWIDLLQSQPENIVWIKPVITKHTVGYVFTLYQERSFELYTHDGLRLRLQIDSLQNHRLFFDAIQTHLPHAHIGYSEEVDSLYRLDKPGFIQNLQDKQWYRPIADFTEQG